MVIHTAIVFVLGVLTSVDGFFAVSAIVISTTSAALVDLSQLRHKRTSMAILFLDIILAKVASKTLLISTVLGKHS